MTNITITVADELLPILQKLADQRSITTEFYLSDHVRAHLTSQYKAEIVAKVVSQKLPDLVAMETAVFAIDENIKVRDAKPFVPLPEGN